MRFRDLPSLIAEDYRANGRDWTRPGFRTLAVYRFGVWRIGIRGKLLRAPFSVLYCILSRFATLARRRMIGAHRSEVNG